MQKISAEFLEILSIKPKKRQRERRKNSRNAYIVIILENYDGTIVAIFKIPTGSLKIYFYFCIVDSFSMTVHLKEGWNCDQFKQTKEKEKLGLQIHLHTTVPSTLPCGSVLLRWLNNRTGNSSTLLKCCFILNVLTRRILGHCQVIKWTCWARETFIYIVLSTFYSFKQQSYPETCLGKKVKN